MQRTNSPMAQPGRNAASLALVLALALAPSAASSDGDGMGLTTIGRTGPGLPTCLVRVGDNAVVGTDANLAIMAVTGDLALRGRLELTSTAHDMATIDAATVAVAAGHQGVLLVSVLDPDTPRIVGSMPGGEALAVAATGASVFAGVVVDGRPRLLSFDIHDRNTPTLLASLDLPGPPSSIEVLDGLIAVSITTPSLVITVADDGSTLTTLGSLATTFPPRRIRRAEDRIFVACGMALAGELLEVDASDPAMPRTMGSIRIPGEGTDVLVEGNRAFVAAFGLGLLNIDAPRGASWTRVGALTSVGYAVALAPGLADGDLLVGGRSSSGAAGLTRAHALASGRLESVDTLAMAEVVDVKRLADASFVLRRDRLDIIGLPTPGQPIEPSGHWMQPGADYSRMSVAGDLAAVASGAIVDILDISSLSSPRHVGQLVVTRGAVTSLSLDGAVLAVAQGRDVELFDLCVPSRPRRASIVNLGGECVAVASEGGRTAIVAGDLLRIIDSSDPDAPELLGAAVLPSRAHCVSLDANLAAVGSLEGWIALVDIAAPLAPRLTAFAETSPVAGVSNEGSRLAAAQLEDGVTVFARTASGGFMRDAWLDLPGDAGAVTLDAMSLDVAATGAGSFHLSRFLPYLQENRLLMPIAQFPGAQRRAGGGLPRTPTRPVGTGLYLSQVNPK